MIKRRVKERMRRRKKGEHEVKGRKAQSSGGTREKTKRPMVIELPEPMTYQDASTCSCSMVSYAHCEMEKEVDEGQPHTNRPAAP